MNTSGTTVAWAIYNEIECSYAVNVGDSRVILGKVNPKHRTPDEQEAIAEVITKDHKPEDKNETERIEAHGGSISLDNKDVRHVVWERKWSIQTELTTGEWWYCSL